MINLSVKSARRACILLSGGSIERAILVIRGQKVMLDADAAKLYAVPLHVLRQAVKRNRRRFPASFMLELTAMEAAISPGSRPPFAFTAAGLAMLSTILHSPTAVQVNIAIAQSCPLPRID